MGSALVDATVEIVGFGLALPILLSFIWLLLLRIAAKTITYLLVLLVGILGFLITIYFFVLVNDRNTFSSIPSRFTFLRWFVVGRCAGSGR